MVKKKSKKKSVRKVSKKPIKKKQNNSVSNEDKLRKKFYGFQKKIDRLEEFKHELLSLEGKGLTKGFEKEVSIIRSRLKDVTALPQLEKRMNLLRKNIRSKKEVKKKSPIKKLEKRVDNISDKVEDSNIDLKKEIRNLKLSVNENIDNLNKKTKVDSGVGLVVDEEFQDFIKGIKVDLSEKVKNKEKQLNDQLRNDLSLRKRDLENHYNELDQSLVSNYKLKESKLQQKFEDKESNLKQAYDKKVKLGLQKEITEHFSEELRKKFESERSKLDAYYVTKIKKKYHDEFEQRKRILEKSFKSKLNEEMKKQKSIYDGKVQQEKEKVHKTLVKIELRKRDIESKLGKELSNINFYKEEQRNVLKNKLKLLVNEKSKVHSLLESRLKEFDKQRVTNYLKLRKEGESLRKKLSQEAHEKLVSDIDSHRRKIENELRTNFQSKMRVFLKEQKAKMDKTIISKTKHLAQELRRQKEINDLLQENISEKSFQLESLKQQNSRLVAQQVHIKDQEVKKRERFQKILIDKHNSEIQETTNKLEQSYKKKFDNDFKNNLKSEKEKLSLQYAHDKERLKSTLKSSSFVEKRNFKRKLKQEYEIKTSKTTEKVRSELSKKLRNEFNTQLANKILVERKKLENKLKELEADKKKIAEEAKSQVSLRVNKILSEERIKQDKELEQKTKELGDALSSQRQVNESLKKQISERELNLKKQKEQERINLEKQKESQRRLFEKQKEVQRKQSEAQRKENELEKQKIIAESNRSKKTSDVVLRREKKQNELEEQRIRNQAEISKKKTRDLLEKQKEENSNLSSIIIKNKHEFNLRKSEQHRRLITNHKKEMQSLNNRLENEFHKKFEDQLKKQISEEKTRLQNEYNKQIINSKTKLVNSSSKQRKDFKIRLKKKFDNELKKTIEDRKKELQESFKKEFESEIKSQFIIDKKKLENKIKELETKHRSTEADLKLKEKKLLEEIKNKNLALASERESLMDKIALLKKEEDLKVKKERIKTQREITNQEHGKMLELLNKKEDLLKAKVQKQLELELKTQKQAQEQELVKRKEELAKELQNKAKALLG